LIRKNNRNVNMAAVAAPVCLALIWLVQGLVPTEAGLFEGRRLRDAVDGPITAIGDFFFELFTPTYFSFQSTGFAGAGGILGGPVVPNNRSVMTVRAPGQTYLSGATSNIFTGDRWISTLRHGDINTHGLTPGHFEKLETAAALMRGATHIEERRTMPGLNVLGLPFADTRRMSTQDFATLGAARPHFSGRYYLHTYLPVDSMTVVIGTNRTGTIFRPNRLSLLWFYAGSADYSHVSMVSPTGDIRTPGFMSRGTTYHLQFLNVNTRLPFIEDILRQSNQGVYAQRGSGDNLRPTFGNRENSDFQYVSQEWWWREHNPEPITILETERFGVTEMAELFEFFYHGESLGGGRGTASIYIRNDEQLIQWLDIFSAEVLSVYAHEVRQHFLQVPDITPQRVWDLTAEIVAGRENDFDRVIAIRDYLLQFPYTLSPVPVPRGVCFVDHFLFYGQEGYCTYFASAMALMARMAGVPSRYVEGFVLPPAAERDALAVTNRMAHAWAEVYLEGFGWMVIEATPTYALLTSPALTASAIAGMDINWDDEWMIQMMAEWDMDMYDFYRMMREGSDAVAGGIIDVRPGERYSSPSPITLRDIALYTLAALVLIVIGVLLFILARRWHISYKLWRVRSLSPNEQVKIYFKGILEIVSFQVRPLSSGETPHAYGTHMGSRFTFRGDSVLFLDLVSLYYKAKYSPHQATTDEVALMAEAYHDMLDLLEKDRKLPKFLYLRYVKMLGAVGG
ncbi:MAG: transglutaminase-like domain-containing protein, partial [Defluviitaleaceae bacterium]|nr:transglutaminase-like domain-containing protein [Defluviitaleaceae bacterium]